MLVGQSYTITASLATRYVFPFPDGHPFIHQYLSCCRSLLFPSVRADASVWECVATLIKDKNGALYGTTYVGGHWDVGVVFMLSPAGGKWTETVLHTFPFQIGSKDGYEPIAGLTWGPSGSLYGTTTDGGDPGSGIVFELKQSAGVWTETILHRFRGICAVACGKDDGGYLQGGITLDENGALYGMTAGGGKYNYGTVWKITP